MYQQGSTMPLGLYFYRKKHLMYTLRINLFALAILFFTACSKDEPAEEMPQPSGN
jgi:hypothetical protein